MSVYDARRDKWFLLAKTKFSFLCTFKLTERYFSHHGFTLDRPSFKWFYEKTNKLDALRAFIRLRIAISNRSLRVSLRNRIKTNKRIRILQQELRSDIYYLPLVVSLSVNFIPSNVVVLIFEVLFTTILALCQHLKYTSQRHSFFNLVVI